MTVKGQQVGLLGFIRRRPPVAPAPAGRVRKDKMRVSRGPPAVVVHCLGTIENALAMR